MATSERPKANLTDEEAIRLWALYFKRWGELLHDQVLADAERCQALGKFEQSYLRAFWQGVSRRLRRINLKPVSVPPNTLEELETAWSTMRREFAFPLTDDLVAPDVERRLEFFKRKIARDFEQSVADSINRHKVSSPIEQIFLIHWNYQRIEKTHGLALRPQAQVTTDRQTYKVDFLVSREDGESVRIAIELDGHEFHERTKEQASRDKSRERAIVSAGVPILRFTGSEVFNNPRCVIDEVVGYFKPRAV